MFGWKRSHQGVHVGKVGKFVKTLVTALFRVRFDLF